MKEKGKGEEQFKQKDRRGGPLRTRGAQDNDELREKGGGSERRQVNSRARVDRWGNELTRSEVFIPNTISVERLAVVLGVRLRELIFRLVAFLSSLEMLLRVAEPSLSFSSSLVLYRSTASDDDQERIGPQRSESRFVPSFPFLPSSSRSIPVFVTRKRDRG